MAVSGSISLPRAQEIPPNFSFSRNTLPGTAITLLGFWVSLCYSNCCPRKAHPIQPLHLFTISGISNLAPSQTFLPSNKSLTEHIVTNSWTQVVLQGHWPEPLDAGGEGSNMRCSSCFPGELPGVDPRAWGGRRRTCTPYTLLFAGCCQRGKLQLTPTQPCLHLLIETDQHWLCSLTCRFLKQGFFLLSALEKQL